MRTPNRRLVASVLLAGFVFSSVFAAAASLDLSSADLAAGVTSVESCDQDGVTTSYAVEYSATLPGYVVSAVNLSGISTPGCDGRTVKVTLLGAADVALAEQAVTLGTPAANPTSFDFSADEVDASQVVSVAVVIY